MPLEYNVIYYMVFFFIVYMNASCFTVGKIVKCFFFHCSKKSISLRREIEFFWERERVSSCQLTFTFSFSFLTVDLSSILHHR